MNKDFQQFLEVINTSSSNNNFSVATNILTEYIKDLKKENIIYIVKEIGTIPESIEAS